MTNSTLEAFVNSTRNLYQQLDSSNVNYIEIYNTINSHLDIFNENGNSLLENVLPIFALPEFTLPNMAVLYAIITQIQQNKYTVANSSPGTTTGTDTAPLLIISGAVNQEKLLNELLNCIQNSDFKQIAVAIDVYSEICHFLTKILLQLNQSKRGLIPLRTAIQNLQKDSDTGKIKLNMLTTVHSDLLQLSLASKNFSIALSLISNEILDIQKPANAYFDSKYLLSYFYYAGCIYGAMKHYDQSLFYLEQALTVPASVLSQIMIEAYKKFIIISLISKGKLPNLPKYTSRIVINQIKPVCSIYHEIASAFSNFDVEKLNSICQKYEQTLDQDNNSGLIKQLKQSLYKKNIQKLTKTFITLSLADMSVKVKLPSAKEAEIYMLNMIKDGEIFATINQKDGMVSFHDNPEKYDNPVIMEQLTKQMFSCIEMDSNIKEMDKEITTHPHYIQKCQSSSTGACDEGTDQLLQSSKRQQQTASVSLKINLI